MKTHVARTLGTGIVGLVALSASSSAAAVTRGWMEQAYTDGMRTRAPAQAERLEHGEELARAGSLEQALGLFQSGLAADPVTAGLFGLRVCETLAALGRRGEAQMACWQAMQSMRTPAVIEATVRALVTGRQPPSVEEVVEAVRLLNVERAKTTQSPPEHVAAMCTVAESLGDEAMLKHFTNELEQVAPESYPPLGRANAALAAQCPPARFWAGWMAIAAVLLLTGIDALRKVLRSRGAAAPAAFFVGLTLLGVARTARADLPPAPPGAMLSQWPVDDHDPEGHLPPPEQRDANPLEMGYWLQDLIYKAGLASKHGDHAAAVKYYRAMYKAVPDKAISLRLACDEYELLGDLQAAIGACGQALVLEGLTVGDYAHYVRLILKKPGQLSDTEITSIKTVLDHMKQEEAGAGVADDLECDFALRTGRASQIQECASRMQATRPNDVQSIAYEWAAAVQAGDFGTARGLLERAKQAGAAAERLQTMQTTTDSGAKQQKEHQRLLIVVLVGLLALAAGVSGFLVVRARRVEQATA
jgi:tetratricopeptide (TPR) repeat protein